MTTQSQNPDSQRQRTLLIALGGGGLLALCSCLLAAVGLGGYYLYNQQTPTAAEPAVEYILDASPRMDQPAKEGGTRLSVARAVLAEVVRPADPATLAGLRAFGAGAVADSCSDTHLIVPLALASQGQIADAAFALSAGASSDSALAEAMIAAIKDIAKTSGPHTLVVITGGADSCNAQAGELIQQEAARAGIKLQEFVVGFEVDAQEAQAIKSMVAESGGQYLDAPDEATLRNVLMAIQNHIDRPSNTSLALITTASTPGAVITFPTPAAHAGTAVASATEPGPPPETTPTSESQTEFIGQTACDHPYFPLRPGATWTYSGDGFGYTWTVDSVSGNLSNATAVVTISFEAASITYDWVCTGEGVTYFQAGTITSTETGTIANFSVTSQSGASLLAAGNLTPGASWTNSYTYQYDIVGEGLSMSFTSDVSESSTAGEKQTFSTGLGTFDVIPVTTNAAYTSSSEYGSFTSTGSHVAWYAYGVGIVRIESTFDGSSSTTELVSYSIP